jgi:hypothetical protein
MLDFPDTTNSVEGGEANTFDNNVPLYGLIGVLAYTSSPQSGYTERLYCYDAV